MPRQFFHLLALLIDPVFVKDTDRAPLILSFKGQDNEASRRIVVYTLGIKIAEILAAYVSWLWVLNWRRSIVFSYDLEWYKLIMRGRNSDSSSPRQEFHNLPLCQRSFWSPCWSRIRILHLSFTVVLHNEPCSDVVLYPVICSCRRGHPSLETWWFVGLSERQTFKAEEQVRWKQLLDSG